jgi:hypothetical protein
MINEILMEGELGVTETEESQYTDVDLENAYHYGGKGKVINVFITAYNLKSQRGWANIANELMSGG